MKKYYYSDGSNQVGPVSLEELAEAKITKETLIWFEGADDWAMASEIEELNSLFKSVPPPLKQNISTSPPPVSKKETVTTPIPEVKSEKRKINNYVYLVASVLVIILCFKLYNNSGQPKYTGEHKTKSNGIAEPTYSESNNDYEPESDNSNSYTPKPSTYSPPPKPREKTEDEIRNDLYQKESRSPKQYLSADYTYRVTLASNTIVEGTISNSASIAGFKNVEITIKFYSATDALLGDETFTVLKFVPPSGSASFSHKIYGWWPDVEAARWTIESAEAY